MKEKQKFLNTIFKEQETIINIDYSKSEVSIYTCRNAVYSRLLHKLGEPNEKSYIKNQLCGARWNISFKDRKIITSILSRALLIGKVK